MFDDEEEDEDIMTPEERNHSNGLWKTVAEMNGDVDKSFETLEEYVKAAQTAILFDLDHEGETPRNLETNSNLEDALECIHKLKYALGR